MSTIQRLLLLVTVFVVVGGVVFLMTWDIPPPTAHIERVIPDEKLPK
jgi:Na+/H+ antiporter NhaC